MNKEIAKLLGTKEDSHAVKAFKTIIDATPLCFNLWTKNAENILCNKKAVELFKLKDEQEYLDRFMELSPEVQPDGGLTYELPPKYIEEAFEEGLCKFNWMHCRLDGEEIPCEITLIRVDDINGESYVAGFTRDLSAEFLGGEEESHYDEFFKDKISQKRVLTKLASLAKEWLFVLNMQTNSIQFYGKKANEETVEFENILFDKEAGREKVHPEDIELYNQLCDNIENGTYEPLDIRYKTVSGEYRYYRVVYELIANDHGEPFILVGKGLDVQEQKALERKSRIDLLTGCYNKVTAEQLISAKIEENDGTTHALFIVDIDNFKAINDNLGHYFGDEVLKEVSTNLKNLFTDNKDILARIGGDEFVVFVEDARDMNLLREKAEKISEAFRQTYSGDYKDYSISGSIGIAIFPNYGNDYDELYKSADKALYEAKHRGKNQFVFYDESLLNGTMLNLTKVENANKIARSYFDYDLISASFDTLYKNNVSPSSINMVLQFIGKKYNADRCFIFETFDDGKTYTNSYEWCKPGISEEKNNMQNVSKDIFNDLFEAAHDGIVYSNNLKESFTTDMAFDIMQGQGIQSFLHSQVKRDGYVSFFIGLDDCTNTRVWNEKEINSLQYIAKIISIIFQSENLREEVKSLTEYNKISAFISDSADDLVYISDVETYELIYVNKKMLSNLKNVGENDWQGKKCYELLYGKSRPCDFCTNKYLSEDYFFEWTYYNDVFKKTFLLKDKLVKLNDNLVRLEIATDVTKVNHLEMELKEKLEQERTLISCIDMLQSRENPRESINKLLQIIASFHNSDRSYIFEVVDNDRILNNTFEWCASGVVTQLENSQNIPKSLLQGWFDKFEEVGEFHIDSIANELAKDSADYKLLTSQGITSIITAPIHDKEGRIVGLIGVDNPSIRVDQTHLLKSVARFIGNFLNETATLIELEKLSYFDPLTEVRNCNSLTKNLKSTSTITLSTIAVALVKIEDLIGINNRNGTMFGDEVITKVAKGLSGIFGDNVYRVSGDEFVVFIKNISKNNFEGKIEIIKERDLEEEAFNILIESAISLNHEEHLKMLDEMQNHVVEGYFFKEPINIEKFAKKYIRT